MILREFIKSKLIGADTDSFIRPLADDYRRAVIKHLSYVQSVILRFNDKRIAEEAAAQFEPAAVKHIEDFYAAAAKKAVAEIQRIRKADVDLVFNETDKSTMDMIRKSFYWLRGQCSERLQAELKDVIELAFSGGIPRTELPAFLEEKFGNIIKMEIPYFKDVSDHIISQGQNLVRIAQGEKYGVEYYRIMARMDDRTTKLCRSLNGRIIPAGHLQQQSRKIAAADSIHAKKEAAIWPKDKEWGDNPLPNNFGLPPYHFRCRTIVQPVWDVDRAQVMRTASKTPILDMPPDDEPPKISEVVREDVVAAYHRVKAKTGYSNIEIYELQQEMGIDMETLKRFLEEQHKSGQAILTHGDWSLASEEVRSGAVMVNGRPEMQVRFLDKPPVVKPTAVTQPVGDPPQKPSQGAKFSHKIMSASDIGAGRSALSLIAKKVASAKEGNIQLIALDNAVGFYEKLGFKGDLFMGIEGDDLKKLAESGEGFVKSQEVDLDELEQQAIEATGGCLAVSRELYDKLKERVNAKRRNRSV